MPPEAHHPDIDVVCVAVKPTCVTRVAIASINQYVAPRFIRFVTADAERCAALVAMAHNVRCVPQDEVIPGVTKASVERALEGLFPPENTNEKGQGKEGRYLGRERAGWYLQQLVKLGVARHLPDLTSTFLVWDPDMIALEPFRVFSTERSGRTGRERVVRHVGGYAIRSYERAYVALTGDAMRRASAPDGSSYVTHAVNTFERAFVEELLGAFADAWEDRIRDEPGREQSFLPEFSANVFGETRPTFSARRSTAAIPRSARRANDGVRLGRVRKQTRRNLTRPRQARAILASLNPDHLDLGFSEYASYASWVATHHPETVEVVPHARLDQAPARPDAGQFRDPDPERWSPAPGCAAPRRSPCAR